ncbi:MAG: OPT/YSL family transporter [Myxococcales bacterium]|nr:OPT/YSL family transporter [Myxococcales bacterium]
MSTPTPAERPAGAPPDQRYFPAPDEAQFTLRAVAAGCVVGSVVSCTNIYIGLKIGWTFGASIISAVLGYALFAILGKKLSVLETNITQTAGSAAGAMASAAGLVAAIPAMNMLGYDFAWWQLMGWALGVAFLGVFFAVPLRRQVVEIDRLRFPTGTATAETVIAMNSDGGEAMAKAKVLIWSGIAAGAFTLAAYFVPYLESPPLYKWLEGTAIGGALAVAAAWSFKVYLGPALFGAGFLIGPRVALSLVLGAVAAWGILGPMAKDAGWAAGPIMSYANGPRGWLLWPGVALMVAEALTSLALSWPTFMRALKMPRTVGDDGGSEAAEEGIPNSWWMGGLAAGTALTCVLAYFIFQIPMWMTLIAVALSSVLAIVAVRSVGETDINPVGGMGKVTQLVYGGLAPGATGTNLMAAAITGAGASQAGDMMQDLKTGHLLGASPRKQFLAQLIGIMAGVVLVIPVYSIFTSAYQVGGEKLPAPAAHAWKAMAELLTKGFDALPAMAGTAVLVAGIVGIAIPLLRKVDAIKKWVPSGLAMGIAFIIPAYYSMVMFYGLIAWFIWKKINPGAVSKLDFALASGLVAGEGLLGIVNAVLTMLEVSPLVGG